MRLYKENVERIADSEAKIAKLKAAGYRERNPVSAPELSGQAPLNLTDMSIGQLRELAKEKKLEGSASLTKAELLAALKELV